jgi:hypothetical protein
MQEAAARIDEPELMALVREGIGWDADRLSFRAGCMPLASGHGWAEPLPFRQLAADDVEVVAGVLLREGFVPQRLADDPADAAHPLPLLAELPGEALLETRLLRDGADLVVLVEIARPLSRPDAIEFF